MVICGYSINYYLWLFYWWLLVAIILVTIGCYYINHYWCRNPTLAKCGGEAQHFQSWRFGVLRDSRMFRVRQQGPNTSHWGVLDVIEKFLKRRYRKWPRIGHLDICSPSYGQKKGRESLKVGNRPLFDIQFESATRRWKELDEGYNFGLDLIAIQLCSRELWAPKVPGLHMGQFRDSNLGVPGKKSHFDVASVERCRKYYKGEGGGFPRVRAVVSQMSPIARGLSQHSRVSRNVN
jgi:hypothetical protein